MTVKEAMAFIYDENKNVSRPGLSRMNELLGSLFTKFSAIKLKRKCYSFQGVIYAYNCASICRNLCLFK